jgi:hypothetical protein
MRFCWFLTFEDASHETRLAAADKAGIIALIGTTPGLVSADIHTPASAFDIYTADGPSPPLVLQLYFEELTHLEAALAGNGHLQALSHPGAFASLAGTKVTHQAMYARHFEVTEPAPKGRQRLQLPRELSRPRRGLQRLAQPLYRRPSAYHAPLCGHQADRDLEPRRLDRRPALRASRRHAAKSRRF